MSDPITPVTTFFLACECKPGTAIFSVIDPFAYDIVPAYIHGTLGVLHYEPAVYAIIDLYEDADPLMGYICTITHPETTLLLDKLKGFHSSEGFNFHQRVLTEAHTANDTTVDTWVYVLSDKVLDCYESLEQVEYGIWDEDEKLSELLASISSEEEEKKDDRELD